MTSRAPILVAGAWAAINGLWYAADPELRYRVESSWIIFGIVLALFAVLAMTLDRGDQSGEPTGTHRATSLLGLGVLVVIAALFYSRTLSVGLLSDDFVLLARAQSGALADTQWEYLRPFPLAIWRILADPFALHLLNVALHGLNAWLLLRLATQIGIVTPSAVLGAMLFLTFPTAVEPVVWASGVFDVLVTALALTAALALTGVAGTASAIYVALITAAAVLTKETAVVLPALLAACAWMTPRMTFRRASVPIAASAAVILIYVVIRSASGFATSPPVVDVSGYAIKEMVSRPFGTLALPFHAQLLSSQRWIPYLLAVFWPALFVFGAWRWDGHARAARQLLGLAAFVLLSIAPLAGMLFVAPDLQGSRYLYLGSAAWCLVPLVLLRGLSMTGQFAILAPLMILFVVANQQHRAQWVNASLERDRVMAAFRNSGLNCVPRHATGLPDHVNGAYVFRNGFSEAIATQLQSPGAPACDVGWDGTHFSIVSPR